MQRTRSSARRRFGQLLVAVVAVAVLAAACGGDDDDDDAASDDATTETTAASTDTTAAEAEPAATGPNTPEPQPLATREKVVASAPAGLEFAAGLLLAKEMGEFEKENLDVEIQAIPGADATVLLTQNQLDVIPSGFSANVFNLVDTGAPVTWVANVVLELPEQEGYWARKDFVGADGGIDVEKIKGARVAPAIGGGGWGNPGAYTMYNWLVDNGLDPLTDVQVQDITTGADMVTALENDALDIGYVGTPVWQQLEGGECCDHVLSVTPRVSAYIVNTNFLNDRRDVARAFFRALMRTHRTYLQGDYKQDPEVLAALSKVLGQPEDVIAGVPTFGFDPDLGFDTEVVQNAQAMFRAAGVLGYEEDIPVEELVDTSVPDEVREGQ